MSKLFSITSGSKSILTNIINKYPEHQLYLYKSLTENNFKLIDWFPNKIIFKLPITYQVIQSSTILKRGPFINLIFLTLDNKQQKILSAYIRNQLTNPLPAKMKSLFELQSIKNPANFIIGSSWQSNSTYLNWIKGSFVSKFTNEPNNNEFHNNLIKIR